MREDVASAWVVWVCPGCGFTVTRHEESPLEAWCVYCHRALEAVNDEEEP